MTKQINTATAGSQKKRLSAIHWFGIAVGFIFGLWHASVGFSALFVLSSRDSALGVVAILTYSFALLPGTLLGIFKPRLASFCILFCLLVMLVAMRIGYPAESMAAPLQFLLLGALPSLVVSGAFAYVAGVFIRATPPRESDEIGLGRAPSDWRLKARVVATILGFALVIPALPMSLHLAALSYKRADWQTSVSILALGTGPGAVSVLSLFRPIWAAYLAFFFLAFSLLFIFLVMQEVSGFGVFCAFMQLPLAAMGGLLLASRGPRSARISHDAPTND